MEAKRDQVNLPGREIWPQGPTVAYFCRNLSCSLSGHHVYFLAKDLLSSQWKSCLLVNWSISTQYIPPHTNALLFSLWIYSTIHSQRTVQENQYSRTPGMTSKTFCSSVRFFKYTSPSSYLVLGSGSLYAPVLWRLDAQGSSMSFNPVSFCETIPFERTLLCKHTTHTCSVQQVRQIKGLFTYDSQSWPSELLSRFTQLSLWMAVTRISMTDRISVYYLLSSRLSDLLCC